MKKVILALAVSALIFPFSSLQAQDLEDIMSQIGAGMGKASYDDNYKFDTYIQMEVSGQGSSNVLYNAYLNRDGSNYALLFTQDGAESTVIFDATNKSILMLANDGGEKTGVALAVDPEILAAMNTKIDETDESYEQYKTGKAKISWDISVLNIW